MASPPKKQSSPPGNHKSEIALKVAEFFLSVWYNFRQLPYPAQATIWFLLGALTWVIL